LINYSSVFSSRLVQTRQSSPLDHEAKCSSITSSKQPNCNEILMTLQIILVIKCFPFSKEDMRLACTNLVHHPKLLDHKCSLQFREQDSPLHSTKDGGNFRHLICLSSVCFDYLSNHKLLTASQKGLLHLSVSSLFSVGTEGISGGL